MMRYYRTGAHTKHDLKVHLIFVPKYRKRVLHGEVGEAVRDLIRQICTEIDVEIISGKVAVDHIHLFVSHPAHLSVSAMVQKIKGKSSYKLMSRYPHLRKTFWGRHFWARGYCAVSSGNITDEMIQRYIAEQEGQEIQHGDVSVAACASAHPVVTTYRLLADSR
jgi:putative transposase